LVELRSRGKGSSFSGFTVIAIRRPGNAHESFFGNSMSAHRIRGPGVLGDQLLKRILRSARAGDVPQTCRSRPGKVRRDPSRDAPVYFEDELGRLSVAKLHTKDEARYSRCPVLLRWSYGASVMDSDQHLRVISASEFQSVPSRPLPVLREMAKKPDASGR
jgi:hypothetical protein